MRTLTLEVDNQNIKKTGDWSGLVAGTQGYLQLRCVFSRDWTGYHKTAVFSWHGGDVVSEIGAGGICEVPDEAAARTSFKVHIVGTRGADTLRSGRTTVIQRRY